MLLVVMVHISHLMLQFSPENDGYLQCMLDEFSPGVSDVFLTILQHFHFFIFFLYIYI